MIELLNDAKIKDYVDFYKYLYHSDPDRYEESAYRRLYWYNFDYEYVKGCILFYNVKKSFTDKDYKNLLALRENKDLFVDQESIDILEYIINNKDLHKKLKTIHDGSFLSNRIYIFVTEKGIQVNIDCDDNDNKYFKDTIDFMYKNYEYIFIQFPCNNITRKNLLSIIEEDKYLNYYDYD